MRATASALMLLAAVVVAGCGGGDAPRSKARHAGASCSQAARSVVTQSSGAAAGARVAGTSPGQVTCVYAAAQTRVKVQVDTNPQADFRFSRAVEERAQNASWTHMPRKAPVQIFGIARAADWFPADRELLVTDGRRLVSVALVGSQGRLRLAKAVARATLAPR